MKYFILVALITMQACEVKIEPKATVATQITESPVEQEQDFDDLTKIDTSTGWNIYRIQSQSGGSLMGFTNTITRSVNFYHAPDFTDNHCGQTIELPNRASERNIKIMGTALNSDCPDNGYYSCEIKLTEVQKPNSQPFKTHDYSLEIKNCVPNQGQTKYIKYIELLKPHVSI